MTNFSTATLELDALRPILSRFVQTPAATQRLEQMEPRSERDWISQEFANVSEARTFLEQTGNYSLADLSDPQPLLQKLNIEGSLLEGLELLQLAAYLAAASAVRALVGGKAEQYPHLCRLFADLPDTLAIQKDIRKKILPSGELDDRASSTLAEIRHELLRVRARLNRILESFLTGPFAEQLIQDAYVTIRNGRFVIPAKVESQSAMPGVVHGTSSSGATVFLEPLTAIELNNDLIQLQDQEREEVRRILLELTEALRHKQQELSDTIERIAELDWRLARAKFAQANDCVIPELADQAIIEFEQARHPLLVERIGRTRVVPIDIALGQNSSALIISGPNTGGKTVALKTLGLLVLMAQAGLPVPARRAVLHPFRQVLADIGDHQSISENLSTFSAHILNLAAMVEQLLSPALVLIDEIGTGTDPEQGAALAVALLDYLRRHGALVVSTTHYHKVKEYGYTRDGVTNASVEFDERTLRPTFRLLMGMAGSSSGLEIAGRLGLRADIVTQARQSMQPSTLQAEQFLDQLRQQLRTAETHSRELAEQTERLRQQQQQLTQDALRQQLRREEEFRKQLAEKLREVEQAFLQEARWTLRQAQDKLLAAELRRQQQHKIEALREKFLEQATRSDRAGESPGSGLLRAGEKVTVLSSHRSGTVLEVAPHRVVVDVAGKRLSLPVEQVTRTEQETKDSLPQNVRVERQETHVAGDLNVIGCTVDEALERTDRFLDRAILSQHATVRVIHGHGTGRLRKALAAFLASHPHVATHRLGRSEEGGTGVTVIELQTN